jgi:UDP-N-acetylglucosamine--N-acetylmuramyl-(pentapeptide) pyrophosphoryl-undecaprenol N-acetylglucosamine transferase
MPSSPPLILFAGGGTGGHLYPGISVAQALLALASPGTPPVHPLFLCTNREIDQTILTPTGFEFIPQPITPPHTSISGLLRFWRSWRETTALVRQVIAQRKPSAVLGLGGYGAGVAVRLASRLGIPSVLLNQDVIPGKANQFLMRFARAVCCQFDATRLHVSARFRPKLHITGCPIRAEMAQIIACRTKNPSDKARHRTDAIARLGLDPSLTVLVITGASLGAATINDAILEMLSSSPLAGWQILHLAGTQHAPAVRTRYQQLAINAKVVDFTPDMADVWSVADLAVSRSGASSVAELTAFGVPSVLMPYPYHLDMHQRENARVLEEARAAVLVDDAKDPRLNAQRLHGVLGPLLTDPKRRQAMSQAAAQLGKPRAAESVAHLLLDFASQDLTSRLKAGGQ